MRTTDTDLAVGMLARAVEDLNNLPPDIRESNLRYLRDRYATEHRRGEAAAEAVGLWLSWCEKHGGPE